MKSLQKLEEKKMVNLQYMGMLNYVTVRVCLEAANRNAH